MPWCRSLGQDCESWKGRNPNRALILTGKIHNPKCVDKYSEVLLLEVRTQGKPASPQDNRHETQRQGWRPRQGDRKGILGRGKRDSGVVERTTTRSTRDQATMFEQPTHQHETIG